ncbi:MAG: DUF6541 family protein [Actinomycetaceae bacterium]
MDPSGAAWGEIAGSVLVAAAVLLGPGLAVGHAWLRLRGLTLLAAALPLTAGIVGVLTVLAPPLGLPWVPTAVGVLLVVTLAAVGTSLRRRGAGRRAPGTHDADRPAAGARGTGARGAGRVAGRPVSGRSVEDGPPARTPVDRIATALALVGAAVVLLAVTASGLDGLGLGHPIEHRDAAFHYSATALVLSGDGSPFLFGGLDPLFPGSSGVYYPSLWHGLAAVPSAVSDGVVGSHATVLVVALAFYVGVAALARAVAPRLPGAAGLAAVVAVAGTAFPVYSMSFHGQWPWGLSFVLTVPALVLGLRCVRAPREAGTWVAFGLAAVGASLAHGSATAVLAVGATAWAMAVVSGGVARGPAARRLGAALTTIALPLAVAALAWVAITAVPLLSSMGDFERASVSERGELLGTLQYAVPVPPLVGVQGAAWVLTALAVVGLVALVQHRRGRWVLSVAALLLVLRVLAAGPDGPLRDLTALWYKDYDRLEALLVAPMAVIAGAGGAALVTLAVRVVERRAADRGTAGTVVGPDAVGGPGAATGPDAVGGAGAATGPDAVGGAGATSGPAARTTVVRAVSLVAVTAAIAAGTGGFHAGVAAEAIRQGPRQAVPDRPYSMSPGEAAWLRSLRGELGEDALVLGAPASGLVFAPALAGWDVAPLPLYPIPGDPADEVLYELDALGQDPAVCARLEDLGVTHVYLDTPGHRLLGWSYPDIATLPPDTLRTVAAHEDARLMEVAVC